jgi:hypothetical protein
MAVRDLNRLEQAAETVRAVLETLAQVAPAWLAGWLPGQWYVRYGQRGDNWRLPTTDSARAELAVQVGADGFTLLEAVYAAHAADLAWLAHIHAVDVLRQTWVQQYQRNGDQIVWRDKDRGLPPGACMI